MGAESEGPPDTRRVSLLWAVQGHVAAISRLHSEIFENGWDEAAISSLLHHPGSIALVATDGHPMEIGGFVLAQIAADEAEILTLGVSERWRRKGIGARLVEGIKRAATRAGAQSLFLEVAETNTAACGLYARAGFIEVGRRKGYYARADAAPEDAVVMRCALPHGS
jgi:ribosomal-protein-alanine N-acetyltransferase